MFKKLQNIQKQPKILYVGLIFASLSLSLSLYFGFLRNSGSREFAGGWLLSDYHAAVVSSADYPLRLDISTPDTGVFFKIPVAADKAYILEVQGSVLTGRPVLRIGPAPYKYINLSIVKPFTAIKTWQDNLEILMYADEPSVYVLNKLDLRQIPGEEEDIGDAELKRLLLSEVEGLEAAFAAGEKLRAAELLLNWGSHISDGAYRGDPTIDISFLSASEIYQHIWQKDAGGVFCGGFAFFLAKIYNIFDLPAFMVDMGLGDLSTDRVTHVTVVLPIKDDDGYSFYIFDPTVNGAFFDRKSDYADLASILKHYDPIRHALGNGQEFRYEGCFPRDYIVPSSDGKPAVLKGQMSCVAADFFNNTENGLRAQNKEELALLMAHYKSEPRSSSFIVDMLLHEIYSTYATKPSPQHEAIEKEFRSLIASCKK